MKNILNKAFTLIELLIVVAIIAILAAIAVPNFLEAQTRAKVARTRADMRTMATGLETYHIDTNTYPFQNPQFRALRINGTQPLVLENLTTPISYLNSVESFTDPFKATKIYRGATLGGPFPGPDPVADPADYKAFQLYKYYARNTTRAAVGGRANEEKPTWYVVGSSGPDAAVDNLNDPMTVAVNNTEADKAFFYDRTIYDATNGTVSGGSLYRVGGTPSGPGSIFYQVASSAQ